MMMYQKIIIASFLFILALASSSAFVIDVNKITSSGGGGNSSIWYDQGNNIAVNNSFSQNVNISGIFATNNTVAIGMGGTPLTSAFVGTVPLLIDVDRSFHSLGTNPTFAINSYADPQIFFNSFARWEMDILDRNGGASGADYVLNFIVNDGYKNQTLPRSTQFIRLDYNPSTAMEGGTRKDTQFLYADFSLPATTLFSGNSGRFSMDGVAFDSQSSNLLTNGTYTIRNIYVNNDGTLLDGQLNASAFYISEDNVYGTFGGFGNPEVNQLNLDFNNEAVSYAGEALYVGSKNPPYVDGLNGDIYANDGFGGSGNIYGARSNFFSTCADVSSATNNQYCYYTGANIIQFTATRGYPQPFSGSIIALCYSYELTALDNVAINEISFETRIDGTTKLQTPLFTWSATGVYEGCETASRGTHTFTSGQSLQFYMSPDLNSYSTIEDVELYAVIQLDE